MIDKHLDQIVRRALGAVSSTKRKVGEELWFALEATLLDKKAPKDWNPAVFFPIGLAQYALLDHRKDLFADLLDVSLVASYLSTLLPWNLTKGVYLFDPDLFEELVEAPLDRIPTDLLMRLPEAAPLIVFPRPWRGLVAAWVSLDEDMREEPRHLEFRALFVQESDPVLLPMPLDLKAPTFEGCIVKTEEEVERIKIKGLSPALPRELFDTLRGVLNLALYLCSEEPDLSASPRRIPPLVQHYRYKRTYPEPSPQRIEVGWRLGAALRKARSEETHASEKAGGVGRNPQPHIRRGHWHLYWVGEGSRKDPSKAEPRLRWIQPTLVGKKWLEGELPAVVRPVRPKSG